MISEYDVNEEISKKFNSRAVLMVDDEDQILSVYQRIFRISKIPYPLIISNNPRDALEILCSNPDKIGVIISDFNMPQMIGYEFLSRAYECNKKPIRAFLSSDPVAKLYVRKGFADYFFEKDPSNILQLLPDIVNKTQAEYTQRLNLGNES